MKAGNGMAGVEELWREVSRQAEEISELRSQLRALVGQEQTDQVARKTRAKEGTDDVVPRDRGCSTTSSRMSRAGLLRGGIAAMAGVVAAGSLAQATEAKASSASFSSLRITGPKPKSGVGLDASANFDISVRGVSKDGIGVLGQGYHGLRGIARHADGAGVYGSNAAAAGGVGGGVLGVGRATPGVQGQTTSGSAGVYGLSTGPGPGVLGEANGIGVKGVTDSRGDGVYGTTTGDGGVGVHGEHTHGGTGVLGEADDENGGSSAAVAGIHRGSNSGVYGSSQQGPGATFWSPVGPQLVLTPGAATFPTNPFLDGAFFVDWDSNLYYYKSSKGWIQLA